MIPGGFRGLFPATGDHIIPESEVRRTADLLNAPCRIFEGYSHSPSVEPGWETIASDLTQWIKQETV